MLSLPAFKDTQLKIKFSYNNKLKELTAQNNYIEITVGKFLTLKVYASFQTHGLRKKGCNSNTRVDFIVGKGHSTCQFAGRHITQIKDFDIVSLRIKVL